LHLTRLKTPFYLLFLLLLPASALLSSCNNGNGKTEKNPADTIAVSGEVRKLNDKIAADPKNAELYYERAKAYRNDNNSSLALTDIEKAISLDSLNPLYHFSSGEIAFAAGKSSRAAESFERAIQLKPNFAEAYQKLGELYLIVKEHNKSIATFNKLIEINSADPLPWFFKAMNQKELKDTAGAIRNLQRAVEIDNDYYDAYMQLGTLFAAQKNKLALDYYYNAIRLKELSLEALYGRAYMYQQLGKNDEAIKDYKKIVTIEPGYKLAYFNTGFMQFAAKQTEEAIKSFTQAIEADPDYAEAYYNRGFCYEVLKKFPEALRDYKKSYELKPGYTLALEGIERLEKTTK
jgi:tetratricopeptide (TPR) repeat protein